MMGRSGSYPGRCARLALTSTTAIRTCCWRTIQPWRTWRPGVQAADTCTTADTEGRGNGTFSVMGCSGDIRGANGYFILWGDGPAILADALGDPIARARHFPADLWTLKGLPAVTLPTVAKAPTYRRAPNQGDVESGC